VALLSWQLESTDLFSFGKMFSRDEKLAGGKWAEGGICECVCVWGGGDKCHHGISTASGADESHRGALVTSSKHEPVRLEDVRLQRREETKKRGEEKNNS